MANVKTHLERLNKPFFLTMTRKELKDSIDSMQSLAGNAPIEECLIGSTQKGVVCSVCKEFFLSTRPAIFTRHISNRQQKCQDAIALNVSYRNTACFRQHITQQSPEDNFASPEADPPSPNTDAAETVNAMETETVTVLGQQSIIPYSIAVGATIPTPMRLPRGWDASPFTEMESSRSSSVRKTILEKAFSMPSPGALSLGMFDMPQQPTYFRQSVELMKSYVRKDEDASVWAVHFESIMNGGKENFDVKLRELIAWSSEPVTEQEDQGYLRSFIDLGTTWFEEFAHSQTKRIIGNIRNKLVVFDAHEHGGSLYGGSFVLRDFRQRLKEDHLSLVAFCWRFKSCFLDEFKNWYKQLKDAGRSIDDMVALCVFPKFLLQLFFQSTSSPRSPSPIVIQFSLARCFKVSADDTTPLGMVNCQFAGTRMANTLHLLRAGLLGVVYGWPDEKDDVDPTSQGRWIQECLQLSGVARTCQVTNLLSPMIADT